MRLTCNLQSVPGRNVILKGGNPSDSCNVPNVQTVFEKILTEIYRKSASPNPDFAIV